MPLTVFPVQLVHQYPTNPRKARIHDRVVRDGGIHDDVHTFDSGIIDVADCVPLDCVVQLVNQQNLPSS